LILHYYVLDGLQREERELKTADTKRIQQAMAALAAQQHAARELQRQKDRELAAVKISPEDVDLIATEFEMDKKLAERSLREGKGDVRAAIESLLTP